MEGKARSKGNHDLRMGLGNGFGRWIEEKSEEKTRKENFGRMRSGEQVRKEKFGRMRSEEWEAEGPKTGRMRFGRKNSEG